MAINYFNLCMYLIIFWSVHSSFSVVEAHKKCRFVELECMTFVGWRDGMPASAVSVLCAVNRRNLANIPSRGGLLKSQESKEYPGLHCSESVHMNGPNPRDWNRSTKQLTTLLAFLHLALDRPNLHLAISFFHR